MSTPTAFLAGLEALEQGRYAQAVELLEEFCQPATLDDKYLQAQMSLVTAYHYNNQTEKAIALCQQLSTNNNNEVRDWAQAAILSLQTQSPNTELVGSASEEVTPELTSEQAEELLSTGSKALKQEYYAEAVSALSAYCQKVDPAVKSYGQAQMWLVKAYKGNEQMEDAIALCQELTTSDKPMVQAWAKQFLGTIASTEVIQAVIAPNTSTEGDVTNNVPLPKRTLQDFKNFCQDNLLGELKVLEAKRQQVLVYIIFATIIVAIIILLTIQFFAHQYLDFSSIEEISTSSLFISLFALVIIACIWGWVMFYSSSTETYASGFKSKFIQKIIEFIDTNQTFSYSGREDDRLALNAFIHSQLFQELLPPTKITQNDCVSAQVGETDICFSEICTQAEIKHSWLGSRGVVLEKRFLPRPAYFIPSSISIPFFAFTLLFKLIKGFPYIIDRVVKGQRINYKHFEEEVILNQVSRRKIFKGLFFRANFNKKFKGRTLVLPRDLSSKMQVLTKGRAAIVKLEDPEFANLFVVYGDQVEARFILSASLMEKIVNFRKKAGRKIYISFAESKIYVAIEYDEDIFEPRLFKTMLKFTPMREYYESLQLMLGIVEDLNLNRRIWN